MCRHVLLRACSGSTWDVVGEAADGCTGAAAAAVVSVIVPLVIVSFIVISLSLREALRRKWGEDGLTDLTTL